MEIRIRQIREEDIDGVLEIERETFDSPWSKNAFSHEIKNNLLAKYFVAVKDKEILGYAGIWLILDEAHIVNIAVAKKDRGKGIGEALLREIISYCQEKDIDHITLEVRMSNQVAQNLYSKYDFVGYGVRKGYYSDNEDALVMWRKGD